MTTHKSTLRLSDSWEHSKSDDIGAVVDKHQFVYEIAFTDGDGPNQAQDMFRARRSVPSNDEDALDLAGDLADRFGDVLTFGMVRQITIVNRATEPGEDLVIGGGPDPTGGALIATLFSGGSDCGINLRAGGMLTVTAPLDGYAVTGGSADILRIFNEGTGPIEYDVVIKGTRAS